VVRGTADFADNANLSLQMTTMLPGDWVGAVDARFKWLSTVASGNAQWLLSTVCVADGAIDDPAFANTSNVIDTAKATPSQTNDATIAGVTMTGCTAGSLLHLKVSRDATGGNANDTLAGTASLLGLELTLRRTQ
jgi:hypothetical protein